MTFGPNTIKSIIRALTPWLLTTLGAVAAHFGWHVSSTASLQGLVLAGGLLTVVLHALEHKFPWVGALLGWLGAPVYAPGKASQQATTIATLESQITALESKLLTVPPTVTSVPTPS